MRLRVVLLLAGFLLGAGLSLVGLHSSGAGAPGAAARVPLATATGDVPIAVPTPVPRPTASPAPVRASIATPSTAQPPTADTSELPVAVDQPLDMAVLRERLDTAIAGTALSGPDPALGLVVVDDAGAMRYQRLGSAALLPASTEKLITAAAALRGLGPDHRYTTRALAAAAPDADGTIPGDLILRGSGDPTLATPEFARLDPRRPSTPLAAIADQLVAAGVRRITGRVLGDGGPFRGDPLPDGWHPRYLSGLDGARSTGLTVNAGRRLTIVDGELRAEAAADPVLTTAAELVHLLAQRGVAVDGGAGRLAPDSAPDSTPGSAPDSARGSAPAGDEAVELAAVSSPPLLDLLRFMVRFSDNGIADQVFLSLGLVVEDDATWRGAEEAVRTVLAPLGLDWSASRLADGSGLSRANRVSPALLAGLDAAMSSSELAEEWASTMAVVGQSGTLRSRLRGTVVDARARAKTGTLADVRALSGAVLGPDGGRHHFSLLGNGLDGAGARAVRALQDEVLLILAEDLYGCTRIPVPPASSSPASSPAASQPPAPEAADLEASDLEQPGPLTPDHDYQLVCDAA